LLVTCKSTKTCFAVQEGTRSEICKGWLQLP